MKFENLLARRYISAQKRHTALTVCSIIIAVALITMLCSCFTTLRGIQRAASYEAQPYHVMFYEVTKNQGAAISHMNQVASCELKQNPDGKTYRALVMFGDYIDDHWVYLQKMIQELKLNATIQETPYFVVEGLELNDTLMSYDRVTLAGRFEAVQMIALFFIFVIFFALALRMVIDTAFEVSSKERERQFGVLQSVGATPQQIVRLLTAEGMMLSAIGVPLGIGVGLLFGFLAYQAVLTSGIAEAFFTTEKADQLVHFHINPWITVGGGIIGVCWVFFSAYGTGMRMIKKTPVQAITARSNTVNKVKKHSLLSLLFGWTGKIASRSVRRQPKRFAVTVLSLTVSLTLFASVSSIFHAAEENFEDTWLYTDTFGYYQPDFELFLQMGDGGNGWEEPTAFTEGLQKLEETGYFQNITHYIFNGCTFYPNPDDTTDKHPIYNAYVNRYTYERIFGENPELTYDELTRSGGGILLNVDESVVPADMKTLTLTLRPRFFITEEEYDQLKEEYDRQEAEAKGNYVFDPQNKPLALSIYDEDDNEIGLQYYNLTKTTAEFPIVSRFMQDAKRASDLWEPMELLVFTEDQWLNGDWKLYGDFLFSTGLSCELANDSDYDAARHFLTENSKIYGYGPDDPWMDMYAYSKQIRTTLSAIHIGLTAVLLMIGLIAIVNMINIVSTGILNRKQELAAMQCVGMTRGQMYRMIIIECLQITLWAAVAATILCVILLAGTQQFMISVELQEVAEEKLISYGEPIIKIWLASIAAFFCALTASLLPLHNMQKEPLVEQIRAAE